MKRVIVCSDGTWNTVDQQTGDEPTPTNVVRAAFRIAKRDGAVPQVVFYDQGVGTGNALDRYTGGAFGAGLEDNIHDAYRFLVANYEAGDELFFFGFSRGAYTVRSVVGMIRKCGILRREVVDRYPEAIARYRDGAHPDAAEHRRFRRDFSVGGEDGIPVKFIGVWDTVGALGIPLRGLRWITRRKHQFHDTELSGIVERAHHALAIDERRAPFEPTLWRYVPKPNQTVEQVWFCGVHGDVGGGYPQRGLADIALDWMLSRARAAGLALDKEAMDAHPLHPDPLGPLHDSKRGLYRLTEGTDRAIGLVARAPDEPGDAPRPPDPTQSLHPSVLERWDADAGYRPPGLREFFRRTGDRRGIGG